MERNELKGLIYSMYPSEAEFARSLGWPKNKLNKITNKRREPTVSEVNTIAEGLGKDVVEIIQFFLV